MEDKTKMIMGFIGLCVILVFLLGSLIGYVFRGEKLAEYTCEINDMGFSNNKEDYGVAGFYDLKIEWVKCIDFETGKEVYVKGDEPK